MITSNSIVILFLLISLVVIFFAVLIRKIKQVMNSDSEKGSSNPDNTAAQRKLNPVEKTIQDYRIVNIQSDVSVLAKWTTTIKNHARQLYDEQLFIEEAIALWKIADESERPLLVLVMGEFKTGKSTFINTLLRDDILTTDAAPATAVVTLLTFGSEITATIHYLDGTTENYDASRLKEITAEGDDSKEELRNKIEYVEIAYPNELLKQITIVDTPGLNVHKQSHINSTANFQSRADMVIWVFNATRMATRSELSEIEALGKRLKPVVVVNRIDDIDEEEETIDEVLQNVRKKLGDNVSDILGVSAKQAQKALISGDTQALAESRWTQFMDYIQNQIAQQSETLKIKSIREKLKDFCALLDNSVANQERKLKGREKYFTDSEVAKQDLLDAISDLSRAIDLCAQRISTIDSMKKEVSQIADFQDYGDLKKIPDNINNGIVGLMERELQVLRISIRLKPVLASSNEGIKITSDIEIYELQADRAKMEIKNWLSNFDRINFMREDLDSQKTNIRNLTSDYEKSGLFGGKPVFDFSGRRERLNNAIAERDAARDIYRQERIKAWNIGFTMVRNWYKLDREMRRLYERIGKFLTQEYEKKSTELDQLKDNFANEQEQHRQNLKSVERTRQLLSSLSKTLTTM